MMVQQCMLAAVCTMLCWLPGETVTTDTPCPGGGLAFLQKKWTIWVDIHDINKDGNHSVDDYILLGERLGAIRNLTAQQTQTLKDDLVSAVAINESVSNEAIVLYLSYLYVGNRTEFQKLVNNIMSAFAHGLDPTGEPQTESDVDEVFEAMHHPEMESVIDLYFHMYQDGGPLTVDQFNAKTYDDLTNPCPTATSILILYEEEHQHPTSG